MQVIFHLGTYKTGSSSLQGALYSNRERLVERGVLYPKTRLASDKWLGARHTPLIHDYIAGRAPILPDALIREIASSNCSTVVFSSEAWSDRKSWPHLVRFSSALASLGYRDQRAVVALRKIGEYQVSHFREFTVNRGNIDPFPKYIRKSGSFDYLLLLTTLRGVFQNKLSVLSYNEMEDATSSLLSAMGLLDEFDTQEKFRKSNLKSISAVYVEAIRCARVLGKPREDALRVVEEMCKEKSIDAKGWTERFAGDVASLSEADKERISDLAVWSSRRTEAITSSGEPMGRSVYDLTPLIQERILSSI